MLIESLDVFDFFDDVFGQDLAAIFGDEQVILDADTDAKFLEIKAGLVGDDIASDKRQIAVANIMGIEADEMGDAMEIIVADFALILDEAFGKAFRAVVLQNN